MEKAKRVYDIYFPGCAFPSWVLDTWRNHEFSKTTVFYHGDESLEDVKLLMKHREPCNIGMGRLYDQKKMGRAFGYERGAYELSTSNKLMPNLAVYVRATVLVKGVLRKAHVINAIGLAFDRREQPDYRYFDGKPVGEIVAWYNRMWRLVLAAAKWSGCKRLKIFNVGGGAFAGPHGGDNFIRNIFEPAFAPLLLDFKQSGIEVDGYNWAAHRFHGDTIPDVLEVEDLDEVAFVNAWDPWSLIGNGNERDFSLDGAWGRISNMAVLGWSETNPFIQWRVAS